MTATQTEDIIDRHILEKLDFEPEIPCYDEVHECSQKATWRMTTVCCGSSLLICTEHKEFWVNQLVKNINDVRGGELLVLTCGNCSKDIVNPKLITDFWIFTPLS